MHFYRIVLKSGLNLEGVDNICQSNGNFVQVWPAYNTHISLCQNQKGMVLNHVVVI